MKKNNQFYNEPSLKLVVDLLGPDWLQLNYTVQEETFLAPLACP